MTDSPITEKRLKEIRKYPPVCDYCNGDSRYLVGYEWRPCEECNETGTSPDVQDLLQHIDYLNEQILHSNKRTEELQIQNKKLQREIDGQKRCADKNFDAYLKVARELFEAEKRIEELERELCERDWREHEDVCWSPPLLGDPERPAAPELHNSPCDRCHAYYDRVSRK